MPTTKDILERDHWRCRYCGGHARQRDHLIKANQCRRLPAAARERENPRYQVASCRNCNEAIGTRLFVPVGYAYKTELEELTGSVYGVFDGRAETLRTVLA